MDYIGSYAKALVPSVLWGKTSNDEAPLVEDARAVVTQAAGKPLTLVGRMVSPKTLKNSAALLGITASVALALFGYYSGNLSFALPPLIDPDLLEAMPFCPNLGTWIPLEYLASMSTPFPPFPLCPVPSTLLENIMEMVIQGGIPVLASYSSVALVGLVVTKVVENVFVPAADVSPYVMTNGPAGRISKGVQSEQSDPSKNRMSAPVAFSLNSSHHEVGSSQAEMSTSYNKLVGALIGTGLLGELESTDTVDLDLDLLKDRETGVYRTGIYVCSNGEKGSFSIQEAIDKSPDVKKAWEALVKIHNDSMAAKDAKKLEDLIKSDLEDVGTKCESVKVDVKANTYTITKDGKPGDPVPLKDLYSQILDSAKKEREGGRLVQVGQSVHFIFQDAPSKTMDLGKKLSMYYDSQRKRSASYEKYLGGAVSGISRWIPYIGPTSEERADKAAKILSRTQYEEKYQAPLTKFQTLKPEESAVSVEIINGYKKQIEEVGHWINCENLEKLAHCYQEIKKERPGLLGANLSESIKARFNQGMLDNFKLTDKQETNFKRYIALIEKGNKSVAEAAEADDLERHLQGVPLPPPLIDYWAQEKKALVSAKDDEIQLLQFPIDRIKVECDALGQVIYGLENRTRNKALTQVEKNDILRLLDDYYAKQRDLQDGKAYLEILGGSPLAGDIHRMCLTRILKLKNGGPLTDELILKVMEEEFEKVMIDAAIVKKRPVDADDRRHFLKLFVFAIRALPITSNDEKKAREALLDKFLSEFGGALQAYTPSQPF